MALTEKVGFIGGGRMAEALIKGMLQSGLVQADQVMVADPSEERRNLLAQEYKVAADTTAEKLLQRAAIVILAVKPQVISNVLQDAVPQLKDTLLISIAAGIPLFLLEQTVAGSGARVIRVMPNTPALVLAGASALSPGHGVTDNDLERAKQIFDAVGTSVVLEESYLDAVTGLSGSGPAYVFTFIEAMIDAGVKVGLARPVAEQLVLQTVYGSVRLAMEEGVHPAELKGMVTSPGGTTIAGLHEMERGAFRGIMMDAIEAATLRSEELGQQMKGS